MSLLSRILDWHHETKGMGVGMLIAVGVLCAGLWWHGSDWQSAGYATRDQVRAAYGDPGLDVGKPDIHKHPVIDGRRDYHTLVCGRVENDPARPFAALVKERWRRHGQTYGPFGRRDRVRILAVPELHAPSNREAALLRACEGLPPL